MILVDMEMPERCGVCYFQKVGICNRFPDMSGKGCLIVAEMPDDATNGDVFKLLFPHIPKEKFFYKTDWWNAQYKTESEDEE